MTPASGARRRPDQGAPATLAYLLVRLTVVLAAAVLPGPGTVIASANRYFAAPFTVRTNTFTFGQAPTWTDDGRVLFTAKDDSGTTQIHVSELDGSNAKCLTCGLPGPNGWPRERPSKGDWILFCSWRGQTFLGAPCLGGYGTDLYVMRPDGSQVTRLTVSDGGPDPQDNYHPFWSPDGRHLIWTHLDFRFVAEGGTQYEILLADFVEDASGPHLANIRVVFPARNAGIETQAWAPDGSGFLFTQWGGKTLSGWMNGELYVMQLFGHQVSPAHPVVTHLTDGSPAWDEQAAFTPDMRNVIWMSSRDHASWYQTVVSAAQWLGFDAPQANTTFGPLFFEAIADRHFKTELYMMELKSRAVRRLTFDDSIVPEFQFDKSGRRLLWTETGGLLAGGPLGPTRVGRFHLNAGRSRRARAAAAELEPHSGAPLVVERPTRRSASKLGDRAALPPQVAAGLPLVTAALTDIAHQLQGLSQGGGCCTASSSGAFVGGH